MQRCNLKICNHLVDGLNQCWDDQDVFRQMGTEEVCVRAAWRQNWPTRLTMQSDAENRLVLVKLARTPAAKKPHSLRNRFDLWPCLNEAAEGGGGRIRQSKKGTRTGKRGRFWLSVQPRFWPINKTHHQLYCVPGVIRFECARARARLQLLT